MGTTATTDGSRPHRNATMTADQKRYRLRHRLLAARAQKQMTQQQVAKETGWHISKLNRIENGYVSVKFEGVLELARCYGIPEPLDDLKRLTEGSQRLTWGKYKVLSQETVLYFGYEDFAETLRNFEDRLIPGLLQIPEYSRAILTEVYGFSKEVTEEHIAVRQRRQELLTRADAPEFFFLLDESILLRSVGGDILEKQLLRLRELAENERVTIEVLPLSAGATFAMRGPFVHLHFPGADPDVLYLESKVGTEVFPTDQAVTETHRAEFEKLRELSIDLTKWTPREH